MIGIVGIVVFCLYIFCKILKLRKINTFMPNTFIHLISNFLIVGGAYAYSKICKKEFNKYVFLIFFSNLIDADHLLANPIYDSNRCGIGFHPLHSWYMTPVYVVGLFFKKYVFFFVGIFVHLGLDWIECII